ncbi:uncharacterized protein H6S33_001706 [Morchella sextelata]|uniref:uncharacterized protein n=1 Tax=Morchella sextelata TaxID=1174677 RepID=UPI001D046C9B|nr:uncharacterized protein H6S33_001706 [Morchella sextelata]KAH0608572.1 hypothetical protein H6S33_001706 [Morchella sextelata]
MSFVLPRAVRLLRGTQSQVCHYRCLQSSVNHSRPSAPLSNSRRPTERSFHASPTKFSSIKNPYTVLGVPKTASAAEIKKAYYGLARKWHPDTNKEPQAREKFQELQAAYEILRDPEKKTMFDQHGESAFDPSGGFNSGAGAGGFGGHPSGFSGFGGGGFGADFSFEDLFNAFSGTTHGKRSRGPQDVVMGDNIELQATISFMEAAKGTEKDIRTEPLVTCKTCSGSGMKQGEKRKDCGRCGGTGSRIHHMAGGFQMAATCDTCNGEGVVMPRGAECRTCSGAGVTRETRSVHIDIPPGIEDGMRLRVSGEGHAPPASSPGARTIRGDLYIHVRVAPHKDFGRKGADVTYTATLPFTTAILGGKITIPTLDGEVDLKVNQGTNSGDKVTIPGAGMKKIGKSRCGDLRIEYKINLPKKFTHTQRTLLELLADEFKDPHANRIMNVSLDQFNTASDHSSSSTSSTENRPGHSGFLKRLFNSITHHEDKDKPPRNSGAPDEESSKKASGSGSG